MASEGPVEMNNKKIFLLKTSDGEVFEVEEDVARQLKIITHLIDEGCADSEIPLDNVHSHILQKVIEYCKKHVASNDNNEELKTWDAQFVNVDQGTLFDLISAANYLEVKELLDLTSQAVADLIKDKSPEEVRDIFGIENDFTPDEEAAIRREVQWAFE